MQSNDKNQMVSLFSSDIPIFTDIIDVAWLAGLEGKIEDKLYSYQLQVYWSETSTTGSGCCMELINVEIYKVKFYESTDSLWCITTSLLQAPAAVQLNHQR